MRITVKWKDSRTYKSYEYRGHKVNKITEGWITDVPGDEFIYYSAEMALNAIDNMLGGKGRKKKPPIRLTLGIQIVGRKDGEPVCG